MSITEAAVIVFGLFAGYWVVGRLFFRSSTRPGGSGVNQASAPQPRAAQWHEVLQVSPTATEQEIRSAYHSLISQYHPDKVDHLGQELKDLATKKSQEITIAYRAGLSALGLES
jgi:DnaJ like chaperone protein